MDLYKCGNCGRAIGISVGMCPHCRVALVGIKYERSEYDRLRDAAFLRRHVSPKPRARTCPGCKRSTESEFVCPNCGCRDRDGIKLAALYFMIPTVLTTVGCGFIPNSTLRNCIGWCGGIVGLFFLIGVWVMATGVIRDVSRLADKRLKKGLGRDLVLTIVGLFLFSFFSFAAFVGAVGSYGGSGLMLALGECWGIAVLGLVLVVTGTFSRLGRS